MELPLVVTYILTPIPLGNMLLVTFGSIKRCSQRMFEFQLFHFALLSSHYVVSPHHAQSTVHVFGLSYCS
jgi:hypothetical protein